MAETALLAPWANLYVMTGSAAAALVGLMFVVITLVTGEERTLRNPDGIATFSTPTVLHFGAALLISGIMLAPWHAFTALSILLGIIGVWGVVYLIRVTYLAQRLSSYKPDMEDWAYYTMLPFLAYGSLVADALLLHLHPQIAFALAAGVLLLLFIGIRNAWDVVTYLTVGQGAENDISPGGDES